MLEWVLDDALPTRAERCWWDIVPGCAQWNVALDRATALTSGIPDSEQNAEYWRRSAVNVIAPFLCLADLSVPRWTDRKVIEQIERAQQRAETAGVQAQGTVGAAVQGGRKPDATGDAARGGLDAPAPGYYEEFARWLELKLGANHVAARRLRNFYRDEVTSPQARANVLTVVGTQVFGLYDYEQPVDCRPLDVAELLKGWSTLYITLRPERAQSVAPLVAAFIEALTGRWRVTVPGARPPTLLLALDEVANVAPVRTLPELVATGGGDGIQCLLGFQDTSQAHSRWGSVGDTILQAATYRVVFPGLTDITYLDRLSRLLSREVQPQREISVTDDCPVGARYADARRLIRERTELETALDDVGPMRRPMAEARVTSRLRVARLRDGVVARPDVDGAPLDVLAELHHYTIVEERPVRRPVHEPSDLAAGKPNSILVDGGGSARYVQATGWWRDPLWRSLLGSGPRDMAY